MTDADLSSALYDVTEDDSTELGTDFGSSEKQPELADLEEKFADEKKPSPHTKRNSVAGLFTLIWGGVGTMLVRTEADVPVGRVLQFQAPLAGTKIEEVIAGTWLDTLLQPLVKQVDKMEGLGAVVLFPLLVGAYERNTSVGPMVEPILRQVVRSTLEDMAPILRKQQTASRKAASTISDLNEVFELEKGVDPVDAVLAAIFAPVPEASEEDDLG